ncbi:barstar family protein [Lysobacter sp. H23M47]|nr:barstar family protein [Lysobacter sp. H23M47]
MAEAAASLDFAIARIDLAGCTGKADALERIARGLSFPGWFGGNWDALADCLGDLSWLLAPGYMLLIANSGAWRAAQPEEFDTLLAILNEAALEWRERNVAFWALLPLAAEAMKALENAIESPPDSEASYSGP